MRRSLRVLSEDDDDDEDEEEEILHALWGGLTSVKASCITSW